ncbi:hypothetical protein LCGC14_2262960, partial [marine sediment metagenome]
MKKPRIKRLPGPKAEKLMALDKE